MDIAYTEHPVLSPDKLRLKTMAINKLAETLHRWLWTGSTGGIIVGESRVGKTTALWELMDALKTRSGMSIPTYYYTNGGRDQNTIRSVFRQLCWDVKLPVKSHDTIDHLCDRYVHYLAEKTIAADCPYSVLFVDEVQRLQPKQLNAFAEIYDRLRMLGVALTVVPVCNQLESADLFEILEAPQYAHVRGRFFVQGANFRGLTSQEEVRYCLKQYDTLHFPEEGPTYTEFFLPDAASQGWRLESLSRDIWGVFREYQSNYQLDSWPMKYFTTTMKMLLSDILPYHGIEHFDVEMVHETIQGNGLIPFRVTAIS